jgi:ribonuclease H2 subunit A
MSSTTSSTREWRDKYFTNMPATSSSSVSGARPRGACVLGVDEAGRGPVLGPLVYGACWCGVDELEQLKRVGFADSKVLSEKTRAALFARIVGDGGDALGFALGWRVHVSAPEELSNKMLRVTNYNLNAISHDACIWLIQAALDDGVDVAEVYVDTVGDPAKYQAKLAARFPAIAKIVVSKKADSLFPIVSAASICAKVVRDKLLADWHFRELGLVASRRLGSGYPGDEKTKTWLREHCDAVFAFPSLVRFSWKTTSKLIDDWCVKVQFPEQWDEHEEAASFNERSVVWKQRQQFFAENDCYLADDF